MTRRWRRIVVVALGVSVPMGLLAAGFVAGFRLNLTPSYALGLWQIVPLEREAAVGDLVFVCPPATAEFAEALERGYLRHGLCRGWLSPLIKTIAATEGQIIEIGGTVMIDGQVLDRSELRSADAEGRGLASYSGGTVPAGHLFLFSEFAGSYDSRYFGPIPADGLLGLAKPVLIFAP